MSSVKKISISGLVMLFLLGSPSLFAGDQKSAKKQIEALNKEIMAANKKQDLQEGIVAAEKAYEIAKKAFGDNALETANAMNNLANLYLFAGGATNAEQLYKRAILINIEKLDANSTAMADIYFNLGVAYAAQKKYRDAINILNKAEAIRSEKLGADHPDTRKVKEMVEEFTNLAYPKAEKI